jgi:hypothetical protein
LEWRQAAVGDLYDYVMVGVYYRPITAYEAWRSGRSPAISILGGTQLARDLLGGTPVVSSLLLTLYQGNPDLFRRALAAAMRHANGVMLFDLVYLDRYGWWDLVASVVQPKAATR